MNLPYSTATSGERSIQEVQKILRVFGCGKFGHMMDFNKGELLLHFEYHGREVSVKASINGYAVAWLKQNPYSRRMHCSAIEHERKAKAIASVAVYSVLRDWIKGQVTAVETGILSFDGAFLGQILLPTGRTVMETITAQKMLPPPAEEKVVKIS